ncbi:MAG: PhzF family phenazine biosynthesis protein [Candidatus Heimdallarchaeota archaeon]|nr:PhzF family phenazine biosynthesis protein [Candidatus Heimdallarchaeota archaeon]
MKKIPYVQTSVFVDDRYQFTGNQLATYWNIEANQNLSKEEMQGMALEMNFSESTFLCNSTLKECHSKVRIFTPGRELDFAGHPTLGTSYVIKYKKLIPSKTEKLTLELGIGPINVEYSEDNSISMIQPEPQYLEVFRDKEAIADILGIEPTDILDEYPIQVVSTGFPFLIVPLDSIKSITKISLDVPLLLSLLEDFVTSQLLVFTKETIHNDSHVHVRMFAPSVGVLEDPATGSAAGPLGAYLEKYNVIDNHELGVFYHFEQGYEIQRPSRLNVKCLYLGNKISNVIVNGKTRVVAEGEFYL